MITISDLHHQTPGTHCSNWFRSAVLEAGLVVEPVQGVSVNRDGVITHVLCRSACTISGGGDVDVVAVEAAVHAHESKDRLVRIATLAGRLQASCAYVLYDDDGRVLRMAVSRDGSLTHEATYESPVALGAWLDKITGWKLTSRYEAEESLSAFDNALRQSGTRWPAGVDGVVFDPTGKLTGLLEYRNTEAVPVEWYCSNADFHDVTARGTYMSRWEMLELLSQTCYFPLVVAVWSANSRDIRIKRIRRIVFPVVGGKHADVRPLVAELGRVLRELWDDRASGRDTLRSQDAVGRAAHRLAENATTLSYGLGGKKRWHSAPNNYEDLTATKIYYYSNDFYADDPQAAIAAVEEALR